MLTTLILPHPQIGKLFLFGQAWQLLGRLRQGEDRKFEASLYNFVRSCLKIELGTGFHGRLLV